MTEPENMTDQDAKQPDADPVNLDASASEGADTESSRTPRPRTLPLYQSHKVVEAAKIVAVDADLPHLSDGRWSMTLVGSDGSESFPIYHEVSQQWVTRHTSDGDARKLVGGYLVRYEDGYESWSPAAAFEHGYSPAMPAGTVPSAPLPGGATTVEPALEETVHRTIRTHHVNAANKQLQIDVLDLPGSGAACHLYRISGFDTASNPSDPFVRRHGQSAKIATVLFQNGPIGEVGVNGVTHEALLAILRDRLEAFQEGPYRCDENAGALAHIVRAIHYLNLRTQQREARGVEGTHQV